jgi:hypothetical protein
MKGNAFLILTLVVSATLMVFLQQRSVELRLSDRSKDLGQSYMNRQRLVPAAGFDAALADFIWMRTNLRREPKMKEGLSDEEKKAVQKREAERHLEGYNSVVSLDPTFKKAYNFSILRIMTDLPDKAIALAEMAMEYCPESRKEFAEIAGYIASLIKKDDKQSLKYYEICVSGGPEKDYLGRRYLRTILRIEGIDPYDTSLPILAQRIFQYEKVNKSLQASMTGEGEDALVGLVASSGKSWVQPILMHDIQDFMSRAHLENADKGLVVKIQEVYKSLAPSGHVCSRCYRPYEAGDHFCENCGFAVEAYGVCLRDGTVLRGHYCHVCGVKAGEKK